MAWVGFYVSLVLLYMAGSIAAVAAGWEATLALLRLRPGLGRSALIAAVEAFVGLGTGTLALLVALRWQPEHTVTFVASATAGVAVGLYRQLDALRDESVLQGAIHRATENAQAGRGEIIAELLMREVRFGGASRLIGVGAVLIAVVVEALLRPSV